MNKLLLGNCEKRLQEFPDNCFGSIVTDPLLAVKDQYTDRSMLKEIAEKFLRKENMDTSKFNVDGQGELKFE